jgi:hypothetical protein
MKGIPLRSGKGEVRRKRKRVSEMVEVRDPVSGWIRAEDLGCGW